MLKIQYDALTVPTFRIFGNGSAARIVVVMVHEGFGARDSIWVIGLPGMTMSEHDPGDFHLIESRRATPEDVQQIEQRSEQLLGDAAIPLATVEYGVVPRGFNQMKPSRGAPAPLVAGKAYEVVVVAAGDFGSHEFVP